ncbi:hypothetical protein JW935_15415 [candidate division KSB1 bacterium]|nr:hypothetical protein [candidate division KSB1 bacterium]
MELKLKHYANILYFNFQKILLKKLEEDHSTKYDRVGFRSFILFKKENLRFSKIRDHIWADNKTFGDPLAELFKEKQDIGVTFEAKSKDEHFLRIRLGPYHNEEKVKYFFLENNVDEGLIFDIDIWQTNISIPQLKLVEIIRTYQKYYTDIIEKIDIKKLE